MKVEVEARYKRNLKRVDNLVQAYERAVGPGPGRTTVANTDLLRSAVVFLHATLEDVVRSVLADRWPKATNSELFTRVPFVMGDTRVEKITLGQLAQQFKGKTVDDILTETVESHLEHSNFNNVGEILQALRRAQLDTVSIGDSIKGELGAMMSRRHWIVHQADRNDRVGSGQHAARSLGATTVRGWRTAVATICQNIVAALD